MLTNDYIASWEEFHQACIGIRSPKELTVCYLCGPEPLNDFKVLTELGIHPHNIWAFESDNTCYKAALSEVKKSYFPMLKLHKGKIEQFFINTPKKFDIIYLDACGPIPSKTQNTLRLVSTLLKHQRLESLGALITNFANPDITDNVQRDNFSYLVANYLYPKSFIESYEDNRTDSEVVEGPISYGYYPDSEKPLESFINKVEDNFNLFYGQFITRQIFDLATIVTPWVRLINSNYWDQFFTKKPNIVEEEVSKMQYFAKDGSGGDIIVDPSMFPVQWCICAMYGGGKECLGDINYPKPPDSIKKFRDDWLRQLSGLPDLSYDSKIAIENYDFLRTYSDYYNERLKKGVINFNYARKMFQFCDYPTKSLAFDIIMNQLSYPMHYSIEGTKRWTYKAKQTQMYMDAIIFDECRYIYEWLPTIDLIESGFTDIGQQLSFRFALDGLAKNRRWYNSEYFYGTAVIDQFKENFEAKILSKRIKL